MQPGSSSNINPGLQTRLNQTLVRIEAKKPGTPAVVPQPKKITRTKEEEDVEKGVRSSDIYKLAPSSAPPPYPVLPGEQDIEDDPALMDAIYAVIVNAKGTGHCEIKPLNKGYFCLRMLLRPDIQDVYCTIFQKYIPLITDLNSMRLKCYS